MNVARAAEWENNHEKGLNHMGGNKFTEGKFEEINENFKNRRDNLGHRVHRFAPYSRNALVHTMSGTQERFNVNYNRKQDENQMQGRMRDAVQGLLQHDQMFLVLNAEVQDIQKGNVSGLPNLSLIHIALIVKRADMI